MDENRTSAEGERVLVSEPALPFPVVGIGASAGGLEAIRGVLRALSPETGMAFVIVQHLHPAHRSALAEILSRATPMPVVEVADEPEVLPNRVYVIPPGRDMVLEGGHLKLLVHASTERGKQIDLFFSSLAETQGRSAIAVVLSGTATDGTSGLEDVKAAGGITLAQDDTAQHGGMPQSAIASGCVDLVLSPENIAAELERIGAHPYVAPSEPREFEDLTVKDLAPILERLLNATGVDFAHYKPATLNRRIVRRMLLQKVDKVEAYGAYLDEHPSEIESLYNDILINVTSFFRDPGLFEALKAEVFPALAEKHVQEGPLRAWVLGCSTGEEAYSLAMAFSEFADSERNGVRLQILASDLNKKGIGIARAGVYAKSAMTGVSEERLRRFFVEVEGGYRVNRALREMCVFSEHNAFVDPPFSKIDLVSCRNLLIYLGRPLQAKLMPILHFALKPDGCLVLGGAETVGGGTALFEMWDARHKIYRKRHASPVVTPQFDYRFRHYSTPASTGLTGESAKSAVLDQADSLLLGRYVPAAVVVSPTMDILQFRGDTAPYMAPASGRASLNLLKMIRDDLSASLLQLFQNAMNSNVPVKERVETAGDSVEVEIVPIANASVGRAYLIVFHPGAAPRSSRARGRTRAGFFDGLMRFVSAERTDAGRKDSASVESQEENERLRRELASARTHVQSIVEQYEASSEELQSAGEEAQSSNEELQSINEELETSKEEIQSANEELSTVNDELATRNNELASANDDLMNLFANVDVPIVMLGANMHIRRFNRSAEQALSLIPADVGRPIGHVKLNLAIEIEPLCEEVIRTLVTKELEVQDRNGQWFLLRIRPYRTLDQRIDGAVLAVIDVDTMRRAREYALAVVMNIRSPLVVLDAGLRVRTVNPAFCSMFRVDANESEGRLIYELGNHQWDIPELRRLLNDVIQLGRTFDDYRVAHVFESIGLRTMLVSGRRLVPEEAGEGSILLSVEDVTQREQLEFELKQRVADLAEEDSRKTEFLATLSHELRNPLNAIRGWVQIIASPGAAEADIHRGIEAIDRNSKAQSELINDLVDVHRVASGNIRLDRARVDVRKLVDDAVESALPTATEKGVRLDRDIDPEPAFVLGDPTRLQQVFDNLLINAVKFTPPRGHVNVSFKREGQSFRVTVSDTGIGIARESLPRVFELYRGAETSSRRGTAGLGLGLGIAKHLVELHGGRIGVTSAGPGQGATFTVTLPEQTETRETEVLVKEEVVDRAPTLGGIAVLVVDDEVDAREPLRRLLTQVGAEVVAVASAEEALEHLAQRKFQAIVSDIAMSGRNGYDLVRSIRRVVGNAIPVIALSAYASAKDQELSLREGFDAHLSKPVDAPTLITTVEGMVRRSRPQREQ